MTTELSRRRRDRLIIGIGVISMIALVFSIAFSATTLHNRRDLLDQRQGRALALDVTCGATSAVIEAGRDTIIGASSAPRSAKTERALEALGFPPKAVRDRQAADAAKEYARSIARSVQEQSGRTDLVRADGSLNCAKLKRAVRAAD